jgi:hypothetical protein
VTNRHYTPREEALLREQYVDGAVEVKDIAERIDRTVAQVRIKAFAMGLHRPERLSLRSYAHQARIRLVLAGQAASGFSLAEISGMHVSTVARAAQALVESGQLFKVRLGHRTVRYFSAPAAAERYEANHRKPISAGNVTFTTRAAGHGRAWWPSDAPLHFTPQTKYTIAPPLPERVLRTNTHSRV